MIFECLQNSILQRIIQVKNQDIPEGIQSSEL